MQQSAVSGRSRSRSAGPGPTLALSCSRPGDSQGARYTPHTHTLLTMATPLAAPLPRAPPITPWAQNIGNPGVQRRVQLCLDGSVARQLSAVGGPDPDTGPGRCPVYTCTWDT